ncbi:MAG: glycosyltransferase [Patescibacteria group bacterium]
MRIFIFTAYYPAFLNDFYAKHPEAAHLPYRDHHALLMRAQFGTADFYSKNLALLGHIAEEFIVNNELLQKQWAAEHHISYAKGHFRNIPKLNALFPSRWMETVVEAQIADFQPDVIYSHNLRVLSVGCLGRIKRMAKLLVGQIAAPLPDEQYFRHYDLIVSSFPHFVKKFRDMGINSEYLNLGFEPGILPTLEKTPTQYDTVFVGSFGSKHTAGTELFEYVAQHAAVDLWGPGTEQLPKHSAIRRNHHGEVWGHDMYTILHNAKIALNRHIDVAEDYANNMRLYEATGVGALLLTDAKKNLPEFFTVGKEVVAYASKEELVDKIHYYLAHEQERAAIAKAGQQRTLQDHTYQKRMEELSVLLTTYVR